MSYEKFFASGRQKLHSRASNDPLVSSLAPKYDCSDVVQVTLMSAQKGVESFQGATESEFHAWLFGVYENTKKTLARRLSAQKRDYRRETDAHCDDGFAHIRSSRRSPLSSIISRENCDLVSEALGNLTTDQAEVVRLRFVDRQSLNEIAISMGKSQKAVSGLIYRATKALCVELSK